MPETMDTIVISSSDSEQHPITAKITRKKNKPASKADMHDYYLRHKGAYICQHAKGSTHVEVLEPSTRAEVSNAAWNA